jgi:hypothetical protein
MFAIPSSVSAETARSSLRICPQVRGLDLKLQVGGSGSFQQTVNLTRSVVVTVTVFLWPLLSFVFL